MYLPPFLIVINLFLALFLASTLAGVLEFSHRETIADAVVS
ncbi:hypothetical protein HMPREF0653_00265 [Prevotella disiens JCM 6334 = ATCC 29426]|uniref:Uncharacterized protein n=1 Tax=Prevotella disiens JCM 6334 = ATCC 29426 TaxID=1235811 RepID=A0ABP2YAG6_9BACT|nr:hypothetical protein HMPREF0653_00265 [Prevotella disiens JCM 6334 = ATCC 29426]